MHNILTHVFVYENIINFFKIILTFICATPISGCSRNTRPSRQQNRKKKWKGGASMATRPGHPATLLSAALLATLKKFDPAGIEEACNNHS